MAGRLAAFFTAALIFAASAEYAMDNETNDTDVELMPVDEKTTSTTFPKMDETSTTLTGVDNETSTKKYAKVTGSMTLSVENAAEFVADSTSATAVAKSLAVKLELTEDQVEVELSLKTRRLSGRQLQAGEVLAAFTLTVPADSTDATALAESLAEKVKALDKDELLTEINTQLANLDSPFTITAVTDIAESVSEVVDEPTTPSPSEPSPSTSPEPSPSTTPLEDDEEEGGSILQSQACFLLSTGLAALALA